MIEFVFPEPEEYALVGVSSNKFYAIGDIDTVQRIKLKICPPEPLTVINLKDYANSQDQGD